VREYASTSIPPVSDHIAVPANQDLTPAERQARADACFWPYHREIERILDDFPYFWMDRASTVRPTMTPDEVFSIWKAEFDGAYEERGLFILTMHPHVIGHRARIAMLDRLVTYMKSRPGVWFATHEQIARHVQGGLR